LKEVGVALVALVFPSWRMSPLANELMTPEYAVVVALSMASVADAALRNVLISLVAPPSSTSELAPILS
jgi:hypothetical protein